MEDWANQNSDCPCPICDRPYRAQNLPANTAEELKSIRFRCEAANCEEVYTYDG